MTCLTTDGEQLAFELSEILDKPWATEVSGITAITQLLNRQLYADNSVSAGVRERYRGHDILVTLVPGVGTRLLRPRLEELFDWMVELAPADIAGCVPPVVLRGIVERVVLRPERTDSTRGRTTGRSVLCCTAANYV